MFLRVLARWFVDVVVQFAEVPVTKSKNAQKEKGYAIMALFIQIIQKHRTNGRNMNLDVEPDWSYCRRNGDSLDQKLRQLRLGSHTRWNT